MTHHYNLIQKSHTLQEYFTICKETSPYERSRQETRTALLFDPWTHQNHTSYMIFSSSYTWTHQCSSCGHDPTVVLSSAMVLSWCVASVSNRALYSIPSAHFPHPIGESEEWFWWSWSWKMTRWL